MAGKTLIEWTDATVNFWWGCTQIGPGCDICYAKAWDKRTGGSHFGHGVERRKIKGAVKLLHKLDNDYAWFAADAAAVGDPRYRRRVFIQSMSDLFDNEVPDEWLAEAWHHITTCNRLDIQIVTKRVSVVEKRLKAIGHTLWPRHAGLIITVCNQDEANRDIPRLLDLKARLGIPWVGLSIEPMLGPIDVDALHTGKIGLYPLSGVRSDGSGPSGFSQGARLDWVICGGESGPGARPMQIEWARDLRDQCAAADTPFFMKQMGGPRKPFAPIPDDLMIRQFPKVHS
ncbi:MAG: DUF5131 family protein [Pseudomonadota bacterium]